MEKVWDDYFKIEKNKTYFKELQQFLEKEYESKQIFPSEKDIYNAFKFTPLANVKVVVIGQDPYHDEGQAHGLCFSVTKEVVPPPSLGNIYKELHDDLGYKIPNHGSLVSWAKQGVLLINTVLTVEAHKANSHRNRGWEIFSDEVIRILNQQDRPIVFLLWGKPAQLKKKFLTNERHLILETSHPSPLSSYRGFLGSKPFSKTNEFLRKNNVPEINWEIKDI